MKTENTNKTYLTGLLPKPKSVRRKNCAGFELRTGTNIVSCAAARTGAQLLVAHLLEAGINAELKKPSAKANKAVIFERAANFAPEGYAIDISSRRMLVQASSAAGFFYAAQTLTQLLTAKMTDSVISIPALCIKDQPRFKWRGLMLDCCRHFFSIAELKKIIDTMASLKLNVFHWHLTEDQAWRIEIKKYPKLTEQAAWRAHSGFGMPDGVTPHYKNGKYGGYYTQDDAKEIVRYAAERFITVVPEIELPGHSTAPLYVYPELGCTGGPYELESTGGVFNEVYCAGNDKVFEFLRNVFDEILAIFPSKYIHIGGDECPKDRWRECLKCQKRIKREGLKDEDKLQSWFVRQIEQYLNQHNRNLIGWDEILEGGLAPNATVMSWRGNVGGIAAANMGHDVVMTPTTNCYLDYIQSSQPEEPKAIPGGFLPIEKVYELEPVPKEIKPLQRKHVIGGQANMWTEYVQTDEHLEYMIFPRLCALAEVVWSPRTGRNWADFSKRLDAAGERLRVRGVNYRQPKSSVPKK
ncbi:MAG: beta-N-acetylhexosaminidase [Negativicutes bacterium]